MWLQVAVKVVMRGMTNNLNVRRRFHHVRLSKLSVLLRLKKFIFAETHQIGGGMAKVETSEYHGMLWNYFEL